ncbi:Lactose permease [Meyerozyma sp. JA9]|nr:Lactose permease [Meyerozyma sp. JA9]
MSDNEAATKQNNVYTIEELTHPEKSDSISLNHVDLSEDGYKDILRDHPVTRWHKNRMIIYFACLSIYLVSTTNGYDGSLLTALFAMPNFLEDMGIKSTSGTGLVMSIFQVGQMCATVFVWLGDFIGRKQAIFCGSVVVCVGAIITSVAKDSSTFIGGRFLLSFGSGVSTSLATSYLLEIVSPNERSALCSIYNSLYNIGSIIATWSAYGTHKTYGDSHLSFRIPLWLQLLCPGLVCLSIQFAPESPRFHYLKGNKDKARNFFIKYHANGDESHPIVAYQMAQLEMSLLNVPKLSIKDYFDYRILFRTKRDAKRSSLVIAASWFGQFSGLSVVGYYFTTILLDLGVENETTRLLLNGVGAVMGYISATIGSLLVGRLGRRFVFLYSTSGFVVCFAILAACLATFQNTGNKAAGRAGIAMIYVVGNLFFSFGYTPLQPLYPAEVLSSAMRVRGMGLFQLVQGTASFINTYVAPIAMKNIQYWFYVFFVFWDAFEVVIIYFFFIETKGLSLEEIDLIFLSENPVKSSIICSKDNEAAKAEKKRLTQVKLEEGITHEKTDLV